MTKGLKVLDGVREQLISITAFVSAKNKELSVMYCLKENNDIKRYVDNVIGLKEIEKELKALEIIRNKDVRISVLLASKNVEEYNYSVLFEIRHLTQEEYDLLKEVLL